MADCFRALAFTGRKTKLGGCRRVSVQRKTLAYWRGGCITAEQGRVKGLQERQNWGEPDRKGACTCKRLHRPAEGI